MSRSLKLSQSFQDTTHLLGFNTLYFIAEHGESSPCKIGTSVTPIKRLSSLQIGNYRKLILHEALFIPTWRNRLNYNDFGLNTRNSKIRQRDNVTKVIKAFSPEDYHGLPVNAETMVHQYLKNKLHCHISGEWFDITVSDAIEVSKRLMSEADFIPMFYTSLEMKKRIKNMNTEISMAVDINRKVA